MAHDTTLLAHFYRASIMHADVWRQRLDATTNWAVVTTAAVITFAFGEAQAPHYVLLMALVFTSLFLVMESRRYQIYRVWEVRIRSLHQFVIAPALRGEEAGGPAADREREDGPASAVESGLDRIARHLASTRPRITLFHAAGYRIRRNYGPLFTIVLLAWLLKLWASPEPASDVMLLVERAGVGVLPGEWILIGAGGFFLLAIVAALAAPSEHMVDWSEEASPAGRLIRRARTPRRKAE
ncbi:MAG: DUF2270 domain-containing protein [Gemmatimonadota bacterium]